MGCVSSKIIRRTGSFRQELRNSLQRVGGIEELLAKSKNGGDQFLALLHTANTDSRKIKTESPPPELESEAKRDTPDTCESEPQVYKLPIDKEEEEVSEEKKTDSEAIDKEEEEVPEEKKTDSEAIDKEEEEVPEEKKTDSEATDKEVELKEVETINAWELLAGLEEEKKEEKSIYLQPLEEEEKEEKNIHLQPLKDDGVTRTRSFRTVEDFDAMVARDKPIETKETKDSRRKSIAKELAALRVPSFEFGKSGSLRDWLLQGGQVFSPGSYVTPKFGGFVPSAVEQKDVTGFDFNGVAFDPEMVAQFEKTMEQLTVEEELIIEEILESLGGGDGGGNSSVSDDAVNLISRGSAFVQI